MLSNLDDLGLNLKLGELCTLESVYFPEWEKLVLLS